MTKKMLKKRPVTEDEEMEADIKNTMKRNKRKKKQQQRHKEEDMDDIMKSFEDRINKKLKVLEDAGEDDYVRNNDQEFSKVDIEED